MALATMGSSVLGKFTELFVDYLVFPIGRQFGYLFCYKNNIQNLTEHVKNLDNVEDGVKGRADADERNSQIVGKHVQDWQKKAVETTNEANKVLERRAEVERGCLYGWCPNLLVRYSLSRNAKKISEKLVELQNNGKEYTLFAYPAPPMQKIVITEDCKDFESRLVTINEVMDALENDAIRMIGISGMAGVGKTTMVQEVAKRVEVKKLFDDVAMAVVSNNQDFMKIQSELASMLGLKFEINETSLLVRANKLRTRLSNGKRILVILDDVWEELKMEELGIPFGVGQHCCKVLLTSRNEHVCVEMRCQKNFAVGELSKDEAWKFFKEMAGIEDDNTELQPVAKDVAAECRGLPLAILTLAEALKNKEMNSWNVMLRKLRRNTEMPKRVETAIKLSYDMLETDESKSLLRLCSLFPEDYKIPIECLVRYAVGLRLLKNVETVSEARETVYSLIDQLKNCHLILVGDEESVKLHDVVRDVCISIASKGKDAVMVRCDAGLKKWPREDTFRHYSAISLKFDEFNEFPTGLDCPNLNLLQLECRYERFKQDNICTKFDSGDFFEGMTELRVVSLRSMFLQLPPPPLKSSMNLRTLCLDFCKLDTTDVSMIGSLKSLEILSFFMSTLRALPSEIGQLGNLKLLDLRCEDKVPDGLPPGVLSNLNRLEELYMRKNFSERAEHVELDSLRDLSTLEIFLSAEYMPILKDFCFENLRRFKISIENVEAVYDSKMKYHFQNELDLKCSDMGMLFGIGFRALLERSEIIWLVKMKGLGRNLFDELDEKESVNWKELRVDFCDELEYLIHRALPGKRFGQLKRLTLHELHAMKSLFTGSVVKGFVQLQQLDIFWCSQMEYIVAKDEGEGKKNTERIEFPKLKKLRLGHLSMLQSFYPNSDNVAIESLLHRQVLLPSIEELFLGGIANVVHIVDCQMQVGFFDQLQRINLSNCHKLLNFAVAAQLKLFRSVQTICILGGNAFEAVFDLEGLKFEGEHAEAILGQLESLEIVELPELVHIWKMVPKRLQGFHNLKTLTIAECGSLRYLLSPIMVNLLVNLQDLHLEECKMMEYIVAKEEGEGKKSTERIEFPKLKKLKLKDLPMLRSFYPNSDNVAIESLFHRQVLLTSIEELWLLEINVVHIVDCHMHTWKMVPKGLQGFHNLKTLKIFKWGSLRYLLSPVMVNLLVNLQELHVGNCKMMEEIIETGQGHPEIRIVDDIITKQEGEEVIVFPRLSKLVLWNLENLTVFNSGKCGLQFPSLDQVYFRGCPKLKTFCSGLLCAPKLERVNTTDNPWSWEFSDFSMDVLRFWMGDLNKTIQHIQEREATTMISQKDEEEHDNDDDGAEEDDDDDYDGAEEDDDDDYDGAEEEEKEEEEDDVKKKKPQQQ